MPSKIQTYNVEHPEAVTMGYSTETKRSSLHQAFKLEKEKVLSPRASRSLKLREKGKPLKSEKPVDADCRHSITTQNIDDGRVFLPKTLRSYQKQCPSREETGAEELVKYMSKVPGYLQCIERGNNVEKALNFGVLDWGRLEKWTYNQRQVVSGGDSNSPSSSNASSSFSMSGSSSQSCRSSGSSYLSRRKQSPCSNRHQNSAAEEDGTRVLEEKASKRTVDFGNSETTTQNNTFIHHQLPKTDHHIGSEHSEYNLENTKRADSGSKADASDPYQPPEISTLPSTSGGCDTSASVNEKLKSQNRGMTRQAKKFQLLANEQRHCPGSPLFNRHWPQDHSSSFPQHIDGMFDHLQERIYGSHRFSFEPTESDNVKPTELHSISFSGILPSEEIKFATLSPFPNSCPFPSNIRSSEWSDMNGCLSEHGQGEKVPSRTIHTPLHSDEMANVRNEDKQEKKNITNVKAPKIIAAETPDRLGLDEVKAAAKAGRQPIPDHQTEMIRCSSLKGTSAIRQGKLTDPSDTPNRNKGTGSSRARHSPLRRLLDPLLKPKASNQTHFPETVASSTSDHFSELSHTDKTNGPCTSPHGITNFSTVQAARKSAAQSWASVDSQCSLQNEKHEASTKQALLQLVWKNGLPMFTFSISDNEVLAATKKTNISGKEDYECIYKFYSIHKIKKKSGWISQGSKSKRRELVSNVVGQMTVLCSQCPKLACHDSKNHFTVREFVLFGAELRPTVDGTADSLSNNELAAIIVKVPNEKKDTLNGELLQVDMIGDLSQAKPAEGRCYSYQVGNQETELNVEKCITDVVAILPGEVHGLSDTGRPSSLIERWKSGGLCDCGGWDVGCSLTVLTNNHEASKSSSGVQSCCTADSTHRAELFIQGGTPENRCVFSLVAFKEGLYTVDFHTSIAALQVFSVCLAILHSRKASTDTSEVQNSVQCISTGNSGKGPARREGEAPKSHVQYHPPLSPVGRT